MQKSAGGWRYARLGIFSTKLHKSKSNKKASGSVSEGLYQITQMVLAITAQSDLLLRIRLTLEQPA
jgi:hypothetical protein